MAEGKDSIRRHLPLSSLVVFISIIAFLVGVFNLWSVLQLGGGGFRSQIVIYISTVFSAVLCLFGLVAIIQKAYRMARWLSVAWWVGLVVTSVLAITRLLLVKGDEMDELFDICKDELGKDEKYHLVESTELDTDSDECADSLHSLLTVALVIQMVVMSLCVWLAHWYTRRLKPVSSLGDAASNYVELGETGHLEVRSDEMEVKE